MQIVSPKEIICMMCQILFSRKYKKISSVCRLLNLPIACGKCYSHLEFITPDKRGVEIQAFVPLV